MHPTQAVSLVLKDLDDITIDVPFAPKHLGEFLAAIAKTSSELCSIFLSLDLPGAIRRLMPEPEEESVCSIRIL